MSGVEFLLEGFVVVLLVATIAYAIILNGKLNALRQGKAEFEALVKDLNVAIEQAGRGTVEFRRLSDSNSERLDQAVKDARALRDDLAFLIERGAIVADHLVEGIQNRRSPDRSVIAPPPTKIEEQNDSPAGVEAEISPEDQDNLRKLLSSIR